VAGKEAELLLLPGRSSSALTSTGDVRWAEHLASFSAEPAEFLNLARADAARILAARRHQVEAIARHFSNRRL
jgi:hypothetical protein